MQLCDGQGLEQLRTHHIPQNIKSEKGLKKLKKKRWLSHPFRQNRVVGHPMAGLGVAEPSPWPLEVVRPPPKSKMEVDETTPKSLGHPHGLSGVAEQPHGH
jgi:hypothetical protein